MKRFEQWDYGYKNIGSFNDTDEKKPRSQDKSSLNETKKNLGFQWDIARK